MSQQTIRPTSTKPYSDHKASMSPLATEVDVNAAVTASEAAAVSLYTPLILPTSDPLVAGAIWNSVGVITISAG